VLCIALVIVLQVRARRAARPSAGWPAWSAVTSAVRAGSKVSRIDEKFLSSKITLEVAGS
jgi:hypothetical protein